MTFLDDNTGGYSGQVSNALFLATEKTGKPEVTATGTEFQRFVEGVWAHQRPGGKPPTGDELKDMAKKAGMPDAVAQNIKGGGSAVNVKAMDDANFEYLYEIDSVEMVRQRFTTSTRARSSTSTTMTGSRSSFNPDLPEQLSLFRGPSASRQRPRRIAQRLQSASPPPRPSLRG